MSDFKKYRKIHKRTPPRNCMECIYIADCLSYFTTCPFLNLPTEERRMFWLGISDKIFKKSS